jgi:hypothetical protein
VNLFAPSLSITFPCKNEKAIEELKSLCAQATFGKGSKEVLDTEYRNALVLNPDKFGTNFHPSEFGILERILVILKLKLDELTIKRSNK